MVKDTAERDALIASAIFKNDKGDMFAHVKTPNGWQKSTIAFSSDDLEDALEEVAQLGLVLDDGLND
jgi:hypothetical protein